MENCKYTELKDNRFKVSCTGRTQYFEDGTPMAAGWEFCPWCGTVYIVKLKKRP